MGIISAFRFLRCFGHSITSLNMSFHSDVVDDATRSQRSELIRYVNEYCAQNNLPEGDTRMYF